MGRPHPTNHYADAIKWETPNYFGVDARGIALSQYFCPTEKLGTGSFYFGTFHDHSGNPLEGGSTYRLHVPAEVPVREFWSATVYSLTTSSFFLNATRLTLGSLDKELRKNGDGTSQWSVRRGYPSEAAAFKAAVDAAHVEGIRGSEAEVLVATAKNKFRLKWKFDRDPYPPT